MKALLSLGAVLASVSLTGASSQSTACYPLRRDSVHTTYRQNILNYTSDADSSWSQAGKDLGFPRVEAGAVALSRDEKTCRIAAQRFAANVPARAFRPLSGQVYVYTIGRSHYFVVDPEYYVSEHLSYEMLFTRQWTLVTRLGS